MAIKTPLEATGVSKYRTDMRNAATAVKTLGAELKTCEAEYKATGDQAAYLTQKSNLLEKQITEQKKAVETAEKGLAQMKKQYGENSTQVMEWRTKLAQAKTQLTTMQTELRNTTSALEAMGDTGVDGVADDLRDVKREADNAEQSAEDLGDAVGQIAGKLNRETIIKGLDAVTGKMWDVIKVAGKMGQAIWNASVDAATWADGVMDAIAGTGLTAEEYQQIDYASQFFNTTADAILAGRQKINDALAKGEAIDVNGFLIQTVGMDPQGNAVRRTWKNVLFDVFDALAMIEDEAIRESEAQRIFGRSWKEFSGVIAAGEKEWDRYANNAPTVANESVESLAETSAAVKDMTSQLEVLKLEVLATLAPDIKLIAEAIGDLAKNLTAFVQSKEGQKLLKTLGESITSIVTSLTTQDFSGIVDLATKAIEGLIGAFDWIDKNKDTIVTAIGAIATAFLGLKALSLGLTATNIISSMRGLLGMGAGAGAGTAASTAGKALSSTGAAMSAGLAGVGTTVPLMAATGVFLAGSHSQWNENMQIGEAVAAVQNQIITSAAENVTDVVDSETAARRQALIEQGTNALTYVQDTSGVVPGIGMYVPRTVPNDSALHSAIRAMQSEGELLAQFLDPQTYNAVMGADTGMFGISGDRAWNLVSTAMQQLSASPQEVTADAVEQMTQNGLSMAEGEAEGIEQGADAVNAAAEEALGKGPVNRVKTILQMHSPSRVMAELGMNAALGFADGISEGAKAAIDAASSMAEAVAAIVSSTMMTLASAMAATSRSAGGYGAASSGGIYDGSTTVNIGTYTQNAGGDMYALAGIVAAAQKKGRQGFGRRG